MGGLDHPEEGAPSRDGVEEVEFAIVDQSYPFIGLSEVERCEVRLERMVPRDPGRYAEFFTVDNADPDAVLARAEAHPTVDASAVSRRDAGGLFEFVVDGMCPAVHLAELGALPRVVRATEGHGRIVVEVPPGHDTPAIIGEFVGEHEGAELAARRPKDRCTPVFTDRDLQRAVDERLTDRQQEVLRAAYEAGYYEQPRTTEGREIATALGISGATFSQHVRAAERNLLALLYEERTL